MIFRCAVHPKGLDPFQAAKAWHLRVQQGLPWKAVRLLVRTVSNKAPGQDALEDAVARVDARQHTPEFKKSGIAKTSYANCGRAPMLTPAQKKAIVASWIVNQGKPHAIQEAAIGMVPEASRISEICNQRKDLVHQFVTSL